MGHTKGASRGLFIHSESGKKCFLPRLGMFLTGLKSCAWRFPWAVSPVPPVSWPLLAALILRDWPIWLAPENRTLTDTSSFKRLTLLLPRAQFCQRKAFQPSVDEGGVQCGVCICVCVHVCECMILCERVNVSAHACAVSVFFCCLSLQLCFSYAYGWTSPLSLLYPPLRWRRSGGSLISCMMYESLGP